MKELTPQWRTITEVSKVATRSFYVEEKKGERRSSDRQVSTACDNEMKAKECKSNLPEALSGDARVVMQTRNKK